MNPFGVELAAKAQCTQTGLPEQRFRDGGGTACRVLQDWAGDLSPEKHVRWWRPRTRGVEGTLRELVLSTLCKLGGAGCWASLSQVGTPSLGLSPLMALGLDFSTCRFVLGATSQFAGVPWSSGVGSLPVPNGIFFCCIHFFIQQLLTTHYMSCSRQGLGDTEKKTTVPRPDCKLL